MPEGFFYIKKNMEILTATQQKVNILGEAGSFHHMAALEFFNEKIEIDSKSNFESIFSEVQKNEQQYGVVAIENSIVGSIINNYNLLQASNLHVIGEVYLRVKQNLMALPNQEVTAIKEVHSHPMALMQSSKFLNQYPKIKQIETKNTSAAAKMIADQQLKGVAAIASEKAAEIYGLEIIEEGIETVKKNYTRFWVLSTKPNADNAANNKCSVSFNVGDKPGALAYALSILTDANVNVSKIQSYPRIGTEWEYYFYTDFNYQQATQPIDKIIRELDDATENLRVFGTYKNNKKKLIAN